MKKNNKPKKSLSKLTCAFLAFTLTLVLLVSVGTLCFFGVLYLGGENPDIDILENSTSIIGFYDEEDKPVGNSDENDYAEISQIPSLLRNAFVAVEDKRFYSHHGIDYKRIFGAVWNNMKGNRTQGASTITQQLVKNVYLSSEQTFDRKLKEMQLAIKLEKQLSKEEILEKYLNMLYFGSGEYGVKNASKRFFDKQLNALNPLECAMLAGIVKSPTKYNPINYYDNSIERAKLVLRLMYEQGYVSEEDYFKYKNQDITIKNALIENNIEDIYLKNAIHEACNILGCDEVSIRKSGNKIFTFYSPSAQKALCSTVSDSAYYQDDNINSLAIVCDNYSRGIRALSCRFDIDIYDYNRQVGSTIKPLACYAPALDQGLISPLSKTLDEPASFGEYSPSNYKDIYYGWTSMQDAVAKSLNIPAVKVMQDLSVSTARDYLAKMGINTSDDDNLALALGGTTYGIKMIDLLGGYTTLSNYGAYRRPGFIRKITDAEGNVLYDYNTEVPTRVFDEQSAYLMTTMLQECARTGTGKKLADCKYDIACKTGTVSMSDKNFNSDIYTMSYTSSDTFLFWQGGSSMSADNTGGGVTALMTKNFLGKYYADITPIDFAIPQGISRISIDKYSYDNLNEIVLASNNAPDYAVIKTYASDKCMPKSKDSTYDRITIDNLEIKENSGDVSITFEYNPRLNYKIYKRTFSEGEHLLYDLHDKTGQASFTVKTDSLLGTKITLLPYYVDDDGKEIIGTPSKYYSGFLARKILQ